MTPTITPLEKVSTAAPRNVSKRMLLVVTDIALYSLLRAIHRVKAAVATNQNP
ncbi:MAG: hypothetical protein H6765_02080 [Candidatus Peribacteria bacterium]|nr:MAG: hypothetical protein H6765_02080 [Candidatus Peribacteria bacterium]